MSFSVGRSRPLRSLGLFRSTGKHAAPRGTVQAEPKHPASGAAHRPAHAATMPRLTGSSAGEKAAAEKDDKKAALPSGSEHLRPVRRA
jgi:hypothetical protein